MEQETMGLTCAKPNKRPIKATPEMIMRAAMLIAVDLKCGGEFDNVPVEDIAGDLTNAYLRASSDDGYDLARYLEQYHGWMPSADMVEDLNGMCWGVDRELGEAERQWAAENPMEPPFPIGTTINTHYGPGVIAEIYNHRPATYVVNVKGKDGSPLVRFEDAVQP